MQILTLQVKLFGPQALMVGQDQVELVINTADTAATCEQVLHALGEAYPVLANSLPVSRLAVNHAFALPEDSIHGDEELALIGLVSGG